MIAAKKRAQPAKRLRYQLGVNVRAEVKELIETMAADSGQSQGRVIELLIEKAITYDKWLAAMNKSLDDIKRGNIEVVWRAEGYQPVRTAWGQIWFPPGYPGVERTGFGPWKEGELKAAYPDYDDGAPSEVIKPPPLPADMAGVDPDRLYLVPVPGEGWKWMVASPRAGPGNPQSSSPEGETK